MSAVSSAFAKTGHAGTGLAVFDVKILGIHGCCSGMRAIGSGEPHDSSFLVGDMLVVGLS
jgi:hypothetical protein